MFFRIDVLKKTSALKKSALESLFDRIADLKARKETTTQVFSYEYCKIFRNTFFAKHLWWLLLNRLHYRVLGRNFLKILEEVILWR